MSGAPQPGTAASAATLQLAGWPVRPEADGPVFPLGGLLLLLALLVAALAAWWWGPRRRAGGRAMPPWSTLRERSDPGAPDVLFARRLDAHHRIYVVRWQGTELLLGVGPQSAPTVIDRRPAADAGGQR
jgi:hypothetical protein